MASLFSFFFNENPVENCSDAMASSADLYKKFFWGCLDRGVYFAPSAYEICFMSAAHTDDDLSRAAEAISEMHSSPVIRTLCGFGILRR